MRVAVSRRDLLAAALLPAAGMGQLWGQTESQAAENRFLFFDRDCLVERSGVQLRPAPLEKLGSLVQGDAPGDTLGASSTMSGNILGDDKSGYRLYYTGYADQDSTGGICMAESADALHWTKPRWTGRLNNGSTSNRIQIQGIPEAAQAVQPIVLRLRDGRHRMYFWMHNQQPRMTRYLVAESVDGSD